jgi:hypothetical protein
MNSDEYWHSHVALAAGVFGVLDGDAKTCRELKSGPGLVKYYKAKLLDPNKHANTWGGARNVKFDQETQEKVERYLYKKLCRNPRLQPAELAGKLRIKGVDVADQ